MYLPQPQGHSVGVAKDAGFVSFRGQMEAKGDGEDEFRTNLMFTKEDFGMCGFHSSDIHMGGTSDKSTASIMMLSKTWDRHPHPPNPTSPLYGFPHKPGHFRKVKTYLFSYLEIIKRAAYLRDS